jgi:hypothetical protein
VLFLLHCAMSRADAAISVVLSSALIQREKILETTLLTGIKKTDIEFKVLLDNITICKLTR